MFTQIYFSGSLAELYSWRWVVSRIYWVLTDLKVHLTHYWSEGVEYGNWQFVRVVILVIDNMGGHVILSLESSAPLQTAVHRCFYSVNKTAVSGFTGSFCRLQSQSRFQLISSDVTPDVRSGSSHNIAGLTGRPSSTFHPWVCLTPQMMT